MNINRKSKNNTETTHKTKSTSTKKLNSKQKHILSKPNINAYRQVRNSVSKNTMSFTTLNSNNYSKTLSSKFGNCKRKDNVLDSKLMKDIE